VSKNGILSASNMPSPLRIGLFPYLNVQPLIFGLRGAPGVEIVLDLPSRVADRFRRGELDLAMVPSFEAATLPAPVVDSVCIASEGPVETVMLHHRVSLDRVRSLALDEASRTSAALAKLLICEESGCIPAGTPFSPHDAKTPDADALLVIGDPAFCFARAGFEALDLGEAWRARHALPFVFAVMVRRPGVEESIAMRLLEAVRKGVDAAPFIAGSYNSGVDAERAERYLRSVIRYELGPRERAGLALFYRLAQAKGLLPREYEFHAI
jgi:chorismate dehydratase